MDALSVFCSTTNDEQPAPVIQVSKDPQQRESVIDKAKRALTKRSTPSQPHVLSTLVSGGTLYEVNSSVSISDSEALWLMKHRSIAIVDGYLWCGSTTGNSECLDVRLITKVKTIIADMPVVVDDMEIKVEQAVVVVGIGKDGDPIDAYRVRGSSASAAKFLSKVWDIEILEDDITPGQDTFFTESVNYDA